MNAIESRTAVVVTCYACKRERDITETEQRKIGRKAIAVCSGCMKVYRGLGK